MDRYNSGHGSNVHPFPLPKTGGHSLNSQLTRSNIKDRATEALNGIQIDNGSVQLRSSSIGKEILKGIVSLGNGDEKILAKVFVQGAEADFSAGAPLEWGLGKTPFLRSMNHNMMMIPGTQSERDRTDIRNIIHMCLKGDWERLISNPLTSAEELRAESNKLELIYKNKIGPAPELGKLARLFLFHYIKTIWMKEIEKRTKKTGVLSVA